MLEIIERIVFGSILLLIAIGLGAFTGYLLARIAKAAQIISGVLE